MLCSEDMIHHPCLLGSFFVFFNNKILNFYSIPLPYIICAIVGFILGSFPTAYLLVKRRNNLDIRNVGSGNVGARNAYEITGSKIVGIVVLLIDVLKGGLAVWMSTIFHGEDFWLAAVGGISAVLGHNYSPWVKFKGGRGLATTAGVMILLGWFYVIIWLALYFLVNLFLKHVHLSTVIASIISPFIVLLSSETLRYSILLSHIEQSDLFALGLILSTLILLKHIEPIREFIINKSKS